MSDVLQGVCCFFHTIQDAHEGNMFPISVSTMDESQGVCIFFKQLIMSPYYENMVCYINDGKCKNIWCVIYMMM